MTPDGEEAVVEDEGVEGVVDDEGVVEADEEEAVEDDLDDEGTGAADVDITSFFTEARVSAGKVSEVLVSVKVNYLIT